MARRAKGEGTTFYDNTKKLYVWRGNCIILGIKKTKTITAKRLVDLNAKVKAFQEEISNGKCCDTHITVAEWVDRWLEVFIRPTVRVKSYETYRGRLNNLKRLIGNTKLHSISSLMLQTTFVKMSEEGGVDGNGLSVVSVNECRRYFKMCCASAVKNHIIQDNPVDGTRPLKAEEKEKYVLDESGVVNFLDVVKSGEYIRHGLKVPNNYRENRGTEYYVNCFYNLVSFGLGSGARIGEIRGLTWDCVDFRKNTVSFKQQIVQTDKNSATLEPYLKTDKSRRTIKIDEQICRELKEFRNYQKKYADMLGDKFVNDWNLVFTNTFGKPINLVNFRRRYFYKMLAAAGISREFTLHSMRHTHATLLLKNGVNIKVVSERLGHSSVVVTMKVYAHVLESMEETASATWLDIVGR